MWCGYLLPRHQAAYPARPPELATGFLPVLLNRVPQQPGGQSLGNPHLLDEPMQGWGLAVDRPGPPGVAEGVRGHPVPVIRLLLERGVVVVPQLLVHPGVGSLGHEVQVA